MTTKFVDPIKAIYFCIFVLVLNQSLNNILKFMIVVWLFDQMYIIQDFRRETQPLQLEHTLQM